MLQTLKPLYYLKNKNIYWHYIKQNAPFISNLKKGRINKKNLIIYLEKSFFARKAENFSENKQED